MGKLYQLQIENLYSKDLYDITSFGDDPREIHKHVLMDVISRNERIVKITHEDKVVFNDSKGFFHTSN
tara:strand:+ start:169 stop:372 length:204 start_codon:yes stop_codon:yes gene_type:complete